jgi:hypothetical protein
MARPPASLDRRILDSNKGSTWLRNYRSWLEFGSGTKRTTPDALIYGDFCNVTYRAMSGGLSIAHVRSGSPLWVGR